MADWTSGHRFGRPPGRWPAAARHQSWVARAGHRRPGASSATSRRRAETDAEMARRHAEVFLELLKGDGFASRIRDRCSRTRRACCPSSRVRDRPRCESGAVPDDHRGDGGLIVPPALNRDELDAGFDDASGDPVPRHEARHIHAFERRGVTAGHERESRVSVSRSIFRPSERHGPRVLRPGRRGR